MIIDSMTDLIGNTPLLKLNPQHTGLKNIDLYAKLEMMNPFGSVKDRTAWGIVKDDLEDLKRHNKTIYENSSGNTAKSLQAIASIHGLKFKLVSSLSKVDEQKHFLQVMGAEIQEIATANDCYDPSDPNDPQNILERTARANPGEVYFANQFFNERNPDYHQQTTAIEILDDLGTVDYFIGGLGTAGSSLGIIRKLQEKNPALYSIGVASNPSEFIPGIRWLDKLWETGLFSKENYSTLRSLSPTQAIDGMLALIRHFGVMGGPSSGANYQAALDYLRPIDGTLTERKKAAFIVCDRAEWYISYLQQRRPEIFGDLPKENSVYIFSSTAIRIIPTVSPQTLDQWRQNHPQALIIDIRASDSFNLIRIDNSINMPLEIFEKWIDNRNPFPADTPVLLVCAVGERSRHYAAYLNTLGCKAFNLDGGILAWRDWQQADAA
jgi:S-sulfo-L-cysteine synthase (O-acetyl-L-serine-dependent)